MKKESTILFVSHDANRAGAQLFLLNLMLFLKSKGYNLAILILTEFGSLVQDFESEFKVYYYHKSTLNKRPSFLSKFIKKEPKNDIFKEIKKNHFIDIAYVNTIASAWVIKILKDAFNIPIISHIHELGHSLDLYANNEDRKSLVNNSSIIIACSNAVGSNLVKNYNVTNDQLRTVHSFVKNNEILSKLQSINVEKIKNQFGIPKNKFVVGACGNAEWRKGTDIFFSVANTCITKDKDFVFIWIGIKNEGKYSYQINFDIELMGIKENVILIEQTPFSIELIKALDVFFVSSREDPFPLVMLEAALCKKAILGFDNTGGCTEFLENNVGKIVPYLNIEAAAESLIELKSNPNLVHELGENAHDSVIQNYGFEISCAKIEKIINSQISLSEA